MAVVKEGNPLVRCAYNTTHNKPNSDTYLDHLDI